MISFKSASIPDMTPGKSCNCAFGITEASKERRLLDMLREIAIEEKRQFDQYDRSKDTNETFCGTEVFGKEPEHGELEDTLGLGPSKYFADTILQTN